MIKNSLEEVLKYFKFRNKEKVLKKLNKIISGGKNSLCLLFDFDRTLTIGIDRNGEDITSWHVIRDFLSPISVQKQRQLFAKYRPLEINGTISIKQQETWATKVINLFVKDKINLLEVEEKFQKSANIRPKAQQVFDKAQKLGIPSIILSAGIKQIIDLWAKTFKVTPDLVLATKLITNAKGEIVGFEKDSFIHIHNKKEKGQKKLIRIRDKRPNMIIVGDALEDANIVESGDNILKIRINDPRIDEKYNEAQYCQKTFEKFDLMIKSRSFEPVLRILELMS